MAKGVKSPYVVLHILEGETKILARTKEEWDAMDVVMHTLKQSDCSGTTLIIATIKLEYQVPKSPSGGPA